MRTHSLRRHGAWLLAGAALLLSGCMSADEYRQQADRDAYELVRSRREQLALAPEAFTIEPAPDSLRQRILRGEVKELVPITLAQCLEVAAENSREYQTRKEALYVAALDLTLERWRYALQTGGSLAAAVEGTGDEAQSASAEGRASLTKLLGTGARIVGDIGLNLTRSLISSDGWKPISDIGLAITQPLLSGAGETIVMEPLTQAERDLVYAVRDYERYRNQLVLDVTTRYLRMVQARDAVANQDVNVQNLGQLAQRNRALADAGRLSDIELGQAQQNELRSQNDLLDAQARFDRQRDDFKLFLGLPVPCAIDVLPDALETLAALPQIAAETDEATATRVALSRRYDYLNTVDREADAGRRVVVARDALLAGLDLRANATLASATGKPLEYDLSNANWSVGFDYVAPWERLPQRNAYRQALIAQQVARRRVEQAQDQICADLREDLRQTRTQLEALDIQQQAVTLAERRIESTRMKLDAGRAETRDLIEAQDSLLSARNSATAALIDYTLARMGLYLDMELLRFEDGKIQLAPLPAEEGT